MNIIAGERRGTQLFAPKGMDTRPTQAKVRESLFNILQGETEGAVVLDLFAGSGALSLEALSRGAERAVLCDKDREAAQAITRNIEKLRYQEKTLLLRGDWKTALLGLTKEKAGFDLVFLDPPYRMEIGAECAELLVQQGLLKEGTLLVYEHRAGLKPQLPEGFTEQKLKSYGDTEIHFYRYSKESDGHALHLSRQL